MTETEFENSQNCTELILRKLDLNWMNKAKIQQNPQQKSSPSFGKTLCQN